eukprot:m.31340 g.31340  ORF g.31340 m.31340 type:complete len:328 (+) comp10710_c0_seq1:216-1199(+)
MNVLGRLLPHSDGAGVRRDGRGHGQALGVLGELDGDALADLAPANEAPVLLHAPAQRNLLAVLCAHGLGEGDLGQIGLDGNDAAASRERANVDHQHLVLRQLDDLGGLLVTLCAHTQEAAQEEEADLQLRVDGRQGANRAEDLADHAVRAAERRVYPRADADQAARHGVLQLVVLRLERDDAGEDGEALDLALGVLLHNARANLNLLALLEHAAQNATAGHAALEVVDLAARLVDVERADDDEAGRGDKVAVRDGDLLDNVLADSLDVVLELRRDGDHGGALGHGALHKLEDLVVLLLGLRLLDEVDFVLQDEDVLELHDLDGGQVL